MAEEYAYVLDETGRYRYEKVKKRHIKKPLKMILFAAAIVIVCKLLPGGYNKSTVQYVPPAASTAEEMTGFVGMAERLSDSICSVSAPSVSGGFFGRMVSAQNYTGTVISADGYILASSAAAEQSGVSVRLSDGAEYPAEVVGVDSKTDCAILKIDKTGLTPVEFADSSALMSGMRVAAVGRVLNAQLGTTMTIGTICGVNNAVELSGGSSINLLQTDAASSENAGCMLFDENGRAVGMVTTMISSGAAGISLAVPSNDIMQVTEGITGTGAVPGGLVIGIRGTDSAHGVQVEAVSENSPAEKGGIKKGDLILKADGNPVKSVTELNKIRDSHQKGDAMTHSIYRDGEMIELEIIL